MCVASGVVLVVCLVSRGRILSHAPVAIKVILTVGVVGDCRQRRFALRISLAIVGVQVVGIQALPVAG
ncbi:hypothetical protein KCU88_g361, partial [Aureobasidium melanogenum]